ncbi:MAG TPA: hypothetical protein VIL99_07360 [Ignavibacteria bacterium]
MINKEEQIDSVDLTDLTDEEIHYIGECFSKELKKVLDNYKPYFAKHEFYRKLYSIYYMVKAKLDKEGS